MRTGSYSDRSLFLSIAKALFLFVLALGLCRVSQGGFAAVLALMAVVCAFNGKIGWAIIAYIFLPTLLILNPAISPKSSVLGMAARGGTFLVSLALMFSAVQRRGNHKLPLNSIWLYLVFAAISSVFGYAPSVSYLKLVSFVLFIVGLSIGFGNIDKRAEELRKVRIFLLAFVVFSVFGSYFVKVFLPGAAYLSELRMLADLGLQETTALAEMAAMGGVRRLFVGVFNHSQCLAVVLPASLAWLVCDMLFLERRVAVVHVLVLTAGLPLVYWTGARIAFLITVVSMAIIYFYCLGKIRLRASVRASLRATMTFAIVLLIAAAAVMQVRNKSITKWLRKTDDISGDRRGLGEAVTESRMGKVAENIYDFRQNPILGKGFQVSYDMQYEYKNAGFVLSAPIEKGVLPLMVLGEGGIFGGVAFLVFLICFVAGCRRKHYYCTLTLMGVFLTSNMAEANFFSPGGPGGVLWLVCVGGGFIVDTIVLYRRRIERQMAAFEEMRMLAAQDAAMR